MHIVCGPILYASSEVTQKKEVIIPYHNEKEQLLIRAKRVFNCLSKLYVASTRGMYQCWAGHPCATGIPAGVSHGYVIYPRRTRKFLPHGYPIPVGPLE